MNIAILIVSLGLAIWVFNDAKSLGAERFTHYGLTYLRPIGWAILCAALWLLLPLYLIKRRDYKRLNGLEVKPINWKKVLWISIGSIAICFALLFFSVISDKTALLAPQVEESIRSNFKEHPTFSKLEIHSFDLEHRSGNDYEGILEVSENGKKRNIRIEVIYDGDRFLWNTAR